MAAVLWCGFNRKWSAYLGFCICLLVYFNAYMKQNQLLFIPMERLYSRKADNQKERRLLYVSRKKKLFLQSWTKMFASKLDYEYYNHICSPFEWKANQAVPWSEQKERTDFSYGTFLRWDINPAMEFSSFILQTRYPNASHKYEGGDHWRVNVKGPSSVPVMKRDLRNGSYEFTFLPMLPGTYRIFMTLEYTLCAGLKDPPQDWFVRGTAQGKEQKQGSLYRDVPFINKSLWSGEPLYVNIETSEFAVKEQNEILEEACVCQESNNCSFLWNGFGGWMNKSSWKTLCPYTLEKHYGKQKISGVLWLFGDSVTTQFYHLIKKNPICKEIFKNCMYTYNWLYSLENYNHTLGKYTRIETNVEKIHWDNRDFNIDRLLNELRQVFLHPAMNEDSVLLMNYGLHFTESANYTNFQLLIHKAISLIKKEARCKVIWKTTSSLNRHKYSRPHYHSRRFMTSPRVEQYNAFATKAFCDAGYDVIDIYPLTDAYPDGTGSQKSPYDPVHYDYQAMRPVERLLERVFKIV